VPRTGRRRARFEPGTTTTLEWRDDDSARHVTTLSALRYARNIDTWYVYRAVCVES